MKRKIILVTLVLTLLVTCFTLVSSAYVLPDFGTPVPSATFELQDSNSSSHPFTTPSFTPVSSYDTLATYKPYGDDSQSVRYGYASSTNSYYFVVTDQRDPSLDNYNVFQGAFSAPGGNYANVTYFRYYDAYYVDNGTRIPVRPLVLQYTDLYASRTDGTITEISGNTASLPDPPTSDRLGNEISRVFIASSFYAEFPKEVDGHIVIVTIGYRFNNASYAINNETFNDITFALERNYNDGYTNGYDNGYTEGESIGYTNGYTEGESIGYTNGYTEGESIGFAEGETIGYQSGYEDGTSIKEEGLFGWFFTSIGAFTNAEIFPGFTIGGMLGTILGAFALIWILKLIAGG